MIDISMPEFVGDVVFVFLWPILHVFVGDCGTVASVPMFSVVSSVGCSVLYIVIF